jgi:uncharacterized protein (TIGR03437 family)
MPSPSEFSEDRHANLFVLDRNGRLSSTSARLFVPVSVTVGGIPAFAQYAGAAPGQVAGLMQINVQIPTGVHPGAVWVVVSGN